MSFTFTFTGKESELSMEYFSPMELEKASDYEISLLSFESYNSIPNVDESNKTFHFDDAQIVIPAGTYEIKEIADHIIFKRNYKSIQLLFPKSHITSLRRLTIELFRRA